MSTFINKTIVITGSSRGLGRSIAIGFAKKKANIVINYTQDAKSAEEVYDYIKSLNKNVIIVKFIKMSFFSQNVKLNHNHNLLKMNH